MDGTAAGLAGLALLLAWSGLMFGLGSRLRRSGWPVPHLPGDELPWPAVVTTLAGIAMLLWTAEQRVSACPPHC